MRAALALLALTGAAPLAAQDAHQHHDHAPAPHAVQDPHAGHEMPAPEQDPHAGHDMAAPQSDPHAGHDMGEPQADPHAGHDMGEPTQPASPGPTMETPPPASAGSGPPRAADAIWGAEAMAASREELRKTHGDFPVFWFQGDRLEAQVREGTNGYLWDIQGYYGGPAERYVLGVFRAEGFDSAAVIGELTVGRGITIEG